MPRSAAVVTTCIIALFCGTLYSQTHVTPVDQPPNEPTSVAQPQPLSAQAMEALVAGVAFYPDAIIELILDAVQYPDAISMAVQSGGALAEESWPASVQALAAHPDLLRQLDQSPVISAHLALAARTQLADLWRAIDQVRAAYDAQQDPSTQSTSMSPAAPLPYGYPLATFIAGYWTAQVVDEMQVWYKAAPVAYGQATTTVVGPAGTAATITGSGAAAQVTVGDTTYAGTAGAGSISTSNGTVIYGQGHATGSVTQSADGSSYQTSASGHTWSNSGMSGSGQQSAQGGYTVNPDGSIDFHRESQTNTLSTTGSSQIDHSGSGTITGTGSGSYQGSTNVESTHGNASVNTTLADGQISSTISTNQGQQTITLGDAPSSRSAATQRMARPASVPAPPSRFGQASAKDWKRTSQAMDDIWTLTSKSSQPARHVPTAQPPTWNGFQRPSTSGTNLAPATRNAPSIQQTPSRKQKSPPSRSRGGRPGRR